MQKQIYKAISFSVGAALLIFAIVAAGICCSFYQNYVKSDMKHACDLLIHNNVAPEEMFGRLNEVLDYNVRVSYFSNDGAVIFDSAVPPAQDNHSDRREVIDALKYGTGESVRNSSSIGSSMYYYAARYQDGVIRFAREYGGVLRILIIILTVMFVTGGAMVLLSAVVSINISKRLVQPIEQLAKQLEVLDSSGNEPVSIRNDCEELAPVAARIEELYDSLIMQLEDVQKTARIRREFSANVSHELKTPLTTIKGFGEMLESGIITSPEDVRRYGGTIYRESERLLGLINDIIKISEVEESSGGPEGLVDADMYTVAKEAVACLEDKALKHNVSVSLEGESCILRMQERYMTELVINLVDNAIKYNRPGGSVLVKVNESQGWCNISVKDDGIGIPEEHHGRIFERFYRVDKSRSKVSGGTGLGLAIVKHIAAFHHGTINLFSRPGEGTEIIVKIPVQTNYN